MNLLLLALSFVLGILVTALWAVRTVHREVPAAALARIWDQPQVGTRPTGGRSRHVVQADDDALYDQELDARDDER